MSGPGRKRRAVTPPAGAEERAATVRAARARVEGPGQRRYQPLRCAVTCRRYPVRDIAFLLGITPQRVSQIGLKDDDD